MSTYSERSWLSVVDEFDPKRTAPEHSYLFRNARKFYNKAEGTAPEAYVTTDGTDYLTSDGSPYYVKQ
jgi:hypothetical protein